MKTKKVILKVSFIVVVVSIFISMFVVTSSADSLILDDLDSVGSNDYGNASSSFVMGAEFDVYLGGVSRASKDAVYKVDDATCLTFDSELTYNGLGNSSLKGWSVEGNYMNPSFSTNRFLYKYISSDVTDYNAFWNTPHKYSFDFYALGDAEYYGIRNSYTNETNVQKASRMAERINVVSLNSDYNSVLDDFVAVYDDIITKQGLDEYRYQLPDNIVMSLYADSHTIVDAFNPNGDWEYNWNALVSPYFSLTYTYNIHYYDDIAAENKVVDKKYSNIIYTAISSDPNEFASVDPSVYSGLDSIYEMALAKKAVLSGVVDGSADWSSEWISFPSYTVPIGKVYDRILTDLSTASYYNGYITDLTISVEPLNTRALYGSNTYITNYISARVKVPMRRISIVYNGLYAEALQGTNDNIGSGGSPLYDHFYDTSYNLRKGLDDKFKIVNTTVQFTDNLFDWLGRSLGSVMNIDIIGSISLGDILYVCLGVGLLMFFLKMFSGG